MDNDIFRGSPRPKKPDKKLSRKQKKKLEREEIKKKNPSRPMTDEEWAHEDSKYRGSV